MTTASTWLRTTGLLTASAVLLAACGGSSATNGGNGGGGSSEGFVSIHGSSTVEPISTLIAENYADANADFDFEVGGEGTGDGFADFFCVGDSDISDASRAIKDEEAQICADNGVEYVELLVAFDGMTVLTSPGNDAVSCLSFLDLYALLGPESEGFDNWSDANGLAAELEDELGTEFGESHAPYPDAPLDITAPGEESGTFDSFNELAIEPIAEARGVEDSVVRPDYTASANDNVIIEGISGSDTSLGWVGFAFFVENQDAVRGLEIDGGGGCVAPSAESVSDESYPLSRPLFIYVNTDYAAENQTLADFVDFYVGDGYAAVEEAGYVSLTDEQLSETVAAWEGR